MAEEIAPLGLEREVVEIVLQHTLMRWDPRLEAHVRSEDRPKRWLALAPSSWCVPGGQLHLRLEPMLESIFATANAGFRRSAPSDPNYLALTSFTERVLGHDDLLAEPWAKIASRRVWEPSTTYVVDDGCWFPVDPSDFVPLVLTRMVVRGSLASAELVDRVVALGFPRQAWEERMRDPAAEMRAALDHYLPALVRVRAYAPPAPAPSPKPGRSVTREELLDVIRRQEAARAEQVAAARAEAEARGKEPLDVARLDQLRTLRPRRPERLEDLEYNYYVIKKDMLTLAEFARLLDELTNWSD